MSGSRKPPKGAEKIAIPADSEQWLAELERLTAEAQDSAEDGAFTTRDLCDVWNCGENTARKRLRALQAEGRLEVVKVSRQALDGATRRTSAYRLKAGGDAP